MEPKKLIECPAYLVTDAQNANIAIMSTRPPSDGNWFAIYHSLDLAKEYSLQIGGKSAIKTVIDAAEFRQILESHPQIAGFLVCNGVSTNLYCGVNRRDLIDEAG